MKEYDEKRRKLREFEEKWSIQEDDFPEIRWSHELS